MERGIEYGSIGYELLVKPARSATRVNSRRLRTNKHILRASKGTCGQLGVRWSKLIMLSAFAT